MPKMDLPFVSSEYALVADRITLFYERFPDGRIMTKLVSRTEREVVFKAAVYRAESSRFPAATGWASEKEGDGEINAVACLENTETSAVGRALANLGFTASTKRPSYEEMAKAERAKLRLAQYGEAAATPTDTNRSRPLRVAENASATFANRQAGADFLSDVLRTLRAAEQLGANRERIASLRSRLLSGEVSSASVKRAERAARAWCRSHESRRFPSDGPARHLKVPPGPPKSG